jgi:hypothetical protein
VATKGKKQTIKENKMIIKEKEMKISQTYRADSASHETKSAVRGVMQRLGLTLLACTLTIGAAEAQQAAPPIDGVIGKLQSFDDKSLDLMTPSGAVHVAVKEPSQPTSRYPPI